MTRSRLLSRQGFTLIELLVASGVFLIGFVAVFGLFLAGVRFRKLSDDTARSALAASSLINEIRIDAGREGLGAPHAPEDYVGDGFAKPPSPWSLAENAALGDPASALQLYPYAAQPGVWYRVLESTDFVGGDDAATTALRLRLLVLPWSQAEEPDGFTLDRVNRALGLVGARTNDPVANLLIAELIKRGLAFEYHATIIRHPSWR
ncbi:MAG: prepilin-type N-terminal cleavage/methylation domain-containing protein [Planctomycetes bacterium]|nr:prepilin-type N-terminal cleavage/methylation domain-containing protein [Planctomycetota bacterium]